MTIVFLLEEPSMEQFLKALLPRILNPETEYRLIPHQGKQDLCKSIPRKLRSFHGQQYSFIVLHDQDSNDCQALKQKLVTLTHKGGKADKSKVRIVCHSLESWHLGDFDALMKAFPNVSLNTLRNKRKYQDPDRLGNPEQEIKRLLPSYQKMNGSREIAKHVNIYDNKSKSFQIFIKCLESFTQKSA